jgi:hypothetical protein
MFSHDTSFIAKFLEFFTDEFSSFVVSQVCDSVCRLVFRLGLVSLECLEGCIFGAKKR